MTMMMLSAQQKDNATPFTSSTRFSCLPSSVLLHSSPTPNSSAKKTRAVKDALRTAHIKARPFALRLPARLVNPREQQVVGEEFDLGVVDPMLKDVPLGYVRHRLAEEGKRMLASLTHFKPSAIAPPSSPTINGALPTELELVIKDLASSPTLTALERPTHALAICTKNARHKFTYHLTHSLVLATSCAEIPLEALAQPSSKVTTEEEKNSSAIKVPILPISLPDPTTFSLLHAYLYTHSLPSLIALLLSLPHQKQQTPQQLVQSLRSLPTSSLAALASRIHGLYANAVCLGVEEDDEFWNVVEACWEGVVGCLKARTVGCL